MLKQNLSNNRAVIYKDLYGVYKIINLQTGEFYIGSGVLYQRYREYRSIFNKRKKFAKSWLWENNNKLEDFEFEILELFLIYNKNNLKDREDVLIKKLNPQYNKVKGSRGGIKPPLVKRGKEHHMYGDTEKYKGEKNPMFGKPMSTRKPILQLDLQGNLIKKWDYIMQVKQDGFDDGAVVKCCQGKLKTHKGYKWQYKN